MGFFSTYLTNRVFLTELRYPDPTNGSVPTMRDEDDASIAGTGIGLRSMGIF